MKIKTLISDFEKFAPLALQESYDNSGLNVGFPDDEIKGVLLCIDVVPEVVDEAIDKDCNFIISHHPLIFPNIKKIVGSDNVQKTIIKAIKNDISIYCGHTNFDKAYGGVSMKMCEKLGLENCTALDSESKILKKLSVFVPKSYAEIVRTTLFEIGAGTIGNYDKCSYNVSGFGTFRAGENTNPFVGEQGFLHSEAEEKIEIIFPAYLQNNLISALIKVHPYEEPAYDIYTLENKWEKVGLGSIGEFEEPISEEYFLEKVKKTFNVANIRHSSKTGKKIKKVAVCGGSGASYINLVKSLSVDAYITADVKYHEWFIPESKFILLDIGHFESEQFTKEIFYNIIKKNNYNFATHFSEINTNPINNY